MKSKPEVSKARVLSVVFKEDKRSQECTNYAKVCLMDVYTKKQFNLVVFTTDAINEVVMALNCGYPINYQTQFYHSW